MKVNSLNDAPSVLLVEADEALTHLISLDLNQAGYTAITAHTVAEGLHCIQSNPPALMIVDRMLAGGESGLKLCSHIRSQGDRTPILLLMSRDTVEDRAACLEVGADDYFLKPYRSDAFLKLVSLYLKPDNTGTEQLRFGSLILDVTHRRASRNSRPIDLTMKEFELLKFLMEHPREVLTREQILENVWGYDFLGESNVIEVYIRYLRLKIEQEGEKRLIQTVRGVGYVLRET